MRSGERISTLSRAVLSESAWPWGRVEMVGAEEEPKTQKRYSQGGGRRKSDSVSLKITAK